MSRPPKVASEATPQASMIIAASNKADGVGQRLESILALDYPRTALEVIIASAGRVEARAGRASPTGTPSA